MNEKYNGMVAEYVSDKQRTVGNIFRKLERQGYKDDFLESNSKRQDIELIILGLYPNSEKAITTIRYMLLGYAKFLEEKGLLPDERICRNIQSIDRTLLWERAKPNASTRFLSHEKYLDLIDDVEHAEMNATYYLSLIRVIYEGVYSEDLSALANLKGRDIHDEEKSVTVHRSDGEEYDIPLPSDLLFDLFELSETDTWERRNPYNFYRINIEGLYPDSCFKVENRNKADFDYKFLSQSYRNKIRKVIDEYDVLDELKRVSPKQIFISGIMYRIKQELDKNNIELEDAFSLHNRNRSVTNIIRNELNRCHYKIEPSSLREMVKGSIEIFEK